MRIWYRSCVCVHVYVWNDSNKEGNWMSNCIWVKHLYPPAFIESPLFDSEPHTISPSRVHIFPPFSLSPRMNALLNVNLIDSSLYNGILSGIPVMSSLFSAFCQRLIPDKECRRCAGVSENICRSHLSCCQSINQDRCCIKQTLVVGILCCFFSPTCKVIV